jgi:hypothetical protein
MNKTLNFKNLGKKKKKKTWKNLENVAK